MKRLIWVLILMITLGFSKQHYNPNGHPWTINISSQIDLVEGYGEISVVLPIATWMTIKGGYFTDYYEHSASIGDWYFTSDRAFDVLKVGAELHIPLYKLWEK